MDKLKYVKLENPDGSYSDPIALSANAQNIDVGLSNLDTYITQNNNNITNLQQNDIILNNRVDSNANAIQGLASGGPAGVYATVAALTTADPDHSRIYLVSTDGHWYYYNNGWQSGGIYEAIELDKNSVNSYHLLDLEDVGENNDISIKNLYFKKGYVDGSTGAIISGTSSTGLNSYTDFITIKNNSTYIHCYPNQINANVVYYNNNQEWLASGGVSLYDRNLVIPENAKYYRMSFALNNINDIYKVAVSQNNNESELGENSVMQMRSNIQIGGMPKTIIDGYLEWHWDEKKCLIKNCTWIDLLFDKYKLRIFNSSTPETFLFSWSGNNGGYIYYDFLNKNFGVTSSVNYSEPRRNTFNRIWIGYIYLTYSDPSVHGNISGKVVWDIAMIKYNYQQYEEAYLRSANTSTLKINTWKINTDKSIDITFNLTPTRIYTIHSEDAHYYGFSSNNMTRTIHIDSSQALFFNKVTREIFTQAITYNPISSSAYELLLVNVDGNLVAGKALNNINFLMIKSLKEKLNLPEGTEKIYSGERISLAPKVYYQSTNLIRSDSQDAAVYNNKCFSLDANCLVKVYDLENNYNELQSFYLDQYETIAPHNNTCFFGTEKYESNDIYPLFYTNAYNNQALPRGTLYVYRFISDENGTITSTSLVQTIQIGFTNDEIWISQPNEVRPYGNFIMDTDKHKLYAYLPRQKEPCMRFFKFEMPTLSNGSTVILTQNDILSYFDTPYHSVIQGTTYYNNKIFYTTGLSDNDSNIVVISVDSEKEIAKINVNNLWGESEGIFAYNNKIYAGETRFYIFDFM